MLNRKQFLYSFSSLALLAMPISAIQAQTKGGVANLAMIGEPQTLDPMTTTADLVGTIMQHIYEPLYTFDAKWNIVPMLASSMPKITKESDGGVSYQIEIRKGVKLHNGRDLNADDVIASLNRWMELSPRGKSIAKESASLTANGMVISWKLKAPNASLLAQLALPSGMAAIMAKESINATLSDYVGTGPYKFKERKADQYIIMTRFDGYSVRNDGVKKMAYLDELRFIPVSNAQTRLEGAIAGQFHFADQLPVDSIAKLEKSDASVAVLTESFGFPYIVFNTKEGIFANKALRQAVQLATKESEMLEAAFGDKRFYKVEANHFPNGTPYYSDAGKEVYDQGNANKAKEIAKNAGYKDEPIRIMASRQYEFHYNMALVMAEQLKNAGFKVDIQVVDWATLVQRRADPKLYDLYFTHSGQFPEPMLSPPQLGEGAPGWWDTEAKKSSLLAFNHETDINKRGALWGKVQSVVYDEVPYINVGKFSALSSKSKKLEGYTASTWPYFWNSYLK